MRKKIVVYALGCKDGKIHSEIYDFPKEAVRQIGYIDYKPCGPHSLVRLTGTVNVKKVSSTKQEAK